MADPLEGGGYPALYEAADQASLRGQRRFLRALRVRLGGLLLATFGGAVLLSLDLPVVGGWIALIGFLCALAAETYSVVTRPDRTWYEGRAAAESAKTLAWRYAVRGEQFEGDVDHVDQAFLRELMVILRDLRSVDLASEASGPDQITERMRELRSKSYPDRRDTYGAGRIDHQRAWYASKSEANRRSEHRWTIFLVAAESSGVVGGVLIIATAIPIDFLGLAAAAAATLTAWAQAKQYSNLATAYGIAAQELASIHSEVPSVLEHDWGAFMGQAEEAISREHTLWRASRGA